MKSKPPQGKYQIFTSHIAATAGLSGGSPVGEEVGVTNGRHEAKPPSTRVDHVHITRVSGAQATSRVVDVEQGQCRVHARDARQSVDSLAGEATHMTAQTVANTVSAGVGAALRRQVFVHLTYIGSHSLHVGAGVVVERTGGGTGPVHGHHVHVLCVQECCGQREVYLTVEST